MKNLVVAVYSHPEAYPPTLNAVELLAKSFDKITIVSRNVFKTEWTYPANTQVVTSGEYISIRDSEKRSMAGKVKSFLEFTRLLLKTINQHRPKVVLLYDAFPLLAYRLISPFIKKRPLLWYHNHDVTQPGLSGKFSIGWFAEKNEPRMFTDIDIFSLPSVDRKVFFPLSGYKGRFFFIPNYPSRFFYNPFYKVKTDAGLPGVIRIIYQGSIGTGHGLEEIISILDTSVSGKQLRLVLKGFISDDYRATLQALAGRHGVSDRLEFIGVTPYQDVPRIASDCHIGIGIHRSGDRMNATLGTASNKIYEYAALGLPVIVYDSEQFRKNLGRYSWAFFTDCSRQSLLQVISSILDQYETLSRQAHADFNAALNFETNFSPVINTLSSK